MTGNERFRSLLIKKMSFCGAEGAAKILLSNRYFGKIQPPAYRLFDTQEYMGFGKEEDA